MERQKTTSENSLTFNQKVAIINFMLQTDIQEFHNSHSLNNGSIPLSELRELVTVNPSLKPSDSTETETAQKFIYNAWMRWPKKSDRPLDLETTVEFLFDNVSKVHKHTRSARWQGVELTCSVDWDNLVQKLNSPQEPKETQSQLEQTQEQLARALEECARLKAEAYSLDLDTENHNDGYHNGKEPKEKKHRYNLPELIGFDDNEIQILYKMLIQGLSMETTAAQIKIPLPQTEAIFDSAQAKFRLFLEDKVKEIEFKNKSAMATCKIKPQPIASP